jgi:4-diphosphocytidyl-2-C-methyl-D-erythritol kinase
MRVLCPAKVNLHLEVLGRRPDGFHELRTVFQTIDLWDVLEAEPGPDLALSCDDPSLACDGSNLVLRAAQRLRDRLGPGPGPGARLRLRKRIPAGGGLGGGSSDAAGTLLLLNRLWQGGLDRASLAELASEIGSDCAFFLWGGTAIGTGRGERIEPLPPGPDVDLVLGFPPYGIPTAEVYRRLAALTPPAGGVTVPALLTKSSPEKDFGPARNDLEGVVLEGWPELGAFRARLLAEGARLALVSGSGSTVFGLFDDATGAARAASIVSGAFPSWRVRTSRTVARGVGFEPESS